MRHLLRAHMRTVLLWDAEQKLAIAPRVRPLDDEHLARVEAVFFEAVHVPQPNLAPLVRQLVEGARADPDAARATVPATLLVALAKAVGVEVPGTTVAPGVEPLEALKVKAVQELKG